MASSLSEFFFSLFRLLRAPLPPSACDEDIVILFYFLVNILFSCENNNVLKDLMETFNDTLLFESQDFVLKRTVIYRGYAASISSIDESVSVIKNIGKQGKYIEVIPFAIRLLENGELKEFHEDNGEWGAGIMLHEILTKYDAVNCMLVLTRKVKGCFPPDSLQSEKAIYIKEACESALLSLIDHSRTV